MASGPPQAKMEEPLGRSKPSAACHRPKPRVQPNSPLTAARTDQGQGRRRARTLRLTRPPSLPAHYPTASRPRPSTCILAVHSPDGGNVEPRAPAREARGRQALNKSRNDRTESPGDFGSTPWTSTSGCSLRACHMHMNSTVTCHSVWHAAMEGFFSILVAACAEIFPLGDRWVTVVRPVALPPQSVL